MSKFNNSKKVKFLASISDVSIDAKDDTLTKRSKFNFSYMDFSQVPPGQKFENWNHVQLVKMLDKLRHYSKKPLKYWENLNTGKRGQHVLEIYDKFPIKTKFKVPRYIPHQALWSRFRLESAVRLVGFVLPEEYRNKRHEGTGEFFDCNTFYVVFLDRDHKFYLTEKK